MSERLRMAQLSTNDQRVYFYVSPSLKELIDEAAFSDCRTVSEWLRALVTQELRQRCTPVAPSVPPRLG